MGNDDSLAGPLPASGSDAPPKFAIRQAPQHHIGAEHPFVLSNYILERRVFCCDKSHRTSLAARQGYVTIQFFSVDILWITD
jgi:hypothetical protein